MLISRLVLSMAGTGFAAGIHMTSLRFKPRDIGFAQEGADGAYATIACAVIAAVVLYRIIRIARGDRPILSYRPLSRRASMVYTLAGITAGFILMGLAGSSSLAAAVRRLLIRRPRRAGAR